MGKDKDGIFREVVLSGFPEDYSKDKYVLFSIANFQNNEDHYDVHHSDLQNVCFFSIDENIRTGKLTSDYAISKLPEIADKLNLIHDTKHSLKFWKILVYPWLATVTQVFYERQIMVLDFIQLHKEEPLLLKLVSANSNPKIIDTGHLQSVLSGTPEFNHWCFSRIFERVAPKHWKIEYVDVKFAESSTPLKPTSLFGLFKPLARRIVNNLTPRCSNIYGMTILERIYFSNLLSRKKSIESKGYEENFDFKPSWDPKWVFDFDKILEITYPKELTDLNLRTKFEGEKGKLSFYSNDLYYGLESKIRAATQKEHGEIIIPAQHGGYMIGSGYVNEVVTNIELKQDFFISWGWNDLDLKNIIALPSPLLSKLKDRHNAKNSKVVLMTTAALYYNQRYNSGLSPHLIYDYRSERERFIKNLKVEVRSELYYRPYSANSRSLADKTHMLKRIPDLKILEGKKVHSQLLESKLLVMDNPSTTVAIAMSANIPLILFFKPEYFPFTGDMKEEFSEFERVNIYHKNADSATLFINENYENISSWWNSSDVQAVREKFSKKYALADKNWKNIWSQYFREMK